MTHFISLKSNVRCDFFLTSLLFLSLINNTEQLAASFEGNNSLKKKQQISIFFFFPPLFFICALAVFMCSHPASHPCRQNYLIRLHRRVLDHHALHLVAHIALLVASESEVGCWLNAHYGLVAGRWVWHHGLVH